MGSYLHTDVSQDHVQKRQNGSDHGGHLNRDVTLPMPQLTASSSSIQGSEDTHEKRFPLYDQVVLLAILPYSSARGREQQCA